MAKLAALLALPLERPGGQLGQAASARSREGSAYQLSDEAVLGVLVLTRPAG